MHNHDLSKWQHNHAFDAGNHRAERSTRLVMWLTLVTMVAEIAGGWWYNSMALLADGWHMSSHALAMGLSAFAYAAARRYARDPSFAFGSWKIEILAGYSSAILLLVVAAMMVAGSVERLLSPQPIFYFEAMVVAVVGLAVNLASALILDHGHDREHEHGHSHGHGHSHNHGHAHGSAGALQDLNLKSAYIHVLTDAATSVLAIVALAGGWIYGWIWLDPVMGIVGAIVVALWARRLLIDSGKVLLDREMDHHVVDEIREVIAADFAAGETRLADLHVHRVGRNAWAASLVLATHDTTLTPDRVRAALAIHEEIAHVTVEINPCA